MTAALKRRLISVEDYLIGELQSPIKHEYLAGFVYAMAGARIVHNVIGLNIAATLHFMLRGKRCQPYNSDMKIRIRLPRNEFRFYYPDVSVVCDSNPRDDSFQDEPIVIFEVLSISTRRIDEGEKKDAYLTIPTLGALVLVEQDSPNVVVHRRTAAGFVREEYSGLETELPLSEIGISLPLSDIFATVEFTPELAKEEV
jgi:Uma2 family endonuclease